MIFCCLDDQQQRQQTRHIMSLIDINVAIETLRNNIEYAPASLPGTDHHGLTEPSSITKDPATRKKEALNAMKTISDYIVMRSTASAAGVDRGGVSSTDLQLSVHSILQACGDSSPDIRLAGTDHLNKMIRVCPYICYALVCPLMFDRMNPLLLTLKNVYMYIYIYIVCCSHACGKDIGRTVQEHESMLHVSIHFHALCIYLISVLT